MGNDVMIWKPTATALLLCSVASAGLKVMPSEGKAVGVVEADSAAADWLVITTDRKTGFFIFAEIRVLAEGRVCMWEGPPGIYGIRWKGENGEIESSNVVLGNVANSHPCAEQVPWELKSFRDAEASVITSADANGSLWVFVIGENDTSRRFPPKTEGTKVAPFPHTMSTG